MEFANLGAHCAQPLCWQQDFIPFQCDVCSKWFCLTHRTYRSHGCPNADQKSLQVVLCPICSQSFRVYQGHPPDLIVNEHIRMGECTRHQAKARRQKNRQRCSVHGCCNAPYTMSCTKCDAVVCVHHRFPEDHACRSLATQSSLCRKYTACTIA